MQLNLSQSASAYVRLTLSIVVLLLATVAAKADPRFVVKPAPPWARLEAIDTSRHAIATANTSSSSWVLDDNQVRVTGNSIERYYHYAFRIETQAGLDELSDLRFYFEPSYQQLALHYIRILRGNNVINALHPSEIKTIQQEEELDQKLYNGTFASVVFLNDLRVGDVVDYAFTVSGENPVLGGLFADRIRLSHREVVQKLTFRLLWPAQRALNVKNINTNVQPVIRTSGNETEYLWEVTDVPAVPAEDSTPGWVIQLPTVQLSVFNSWNDVVNWALPMYGVPAPSTPELLGKIEQWKTGLKSPEERMVAALRFVQDEVRYLGIELGRYSHQPTPPAKVFARRFGDCKDKSLLLATILNALGVEAVPALVNPSFGRSLDEWQPTPHAFNHVIVQAKLDGKTYWLDPTISSQRGGLAQYYDPPYERALVLREGSKELEKIPAPSSNSGSTTIKQSYSVSDYGLPVPLVIVTTYRGADADSMRNELSGESLTELSTNNLNYYARQYPSIRPQGTNEVNDDEKANIITVTERYIIDSLWTEQGHYFYADQIYSALNKPGVAKRSTPYEIRYPTTLNQIIEIDLPHRPSVRSDSDSIGDEAMMLSFKQSVEGQRVRLEYSLKSIADHVKAERIAHHIETIDRMQSSLGLRLDRGRSNGITTISTGSPPRLGVILALLSIPLLILLIVVGYRMRARRALKPQWNALQQVRPGTSVASAISVRSAEDITSHLRRSTCNCGNNLYRDDTPPVHERFRYDGQSLTGVRMKCASCTRSTDYYFRQEAEAIQPAS